MKHGKGVRSHKRKTIEVSTNKEIKQCSSHKYSNSLVTRPGFSFKEPRRAASASALLSIAVSPPGYEATSDRDSRVRTFMEKGLRWSTALIQGQRHRKQDKGPLRLYKYGTL